MSVDRESYLVFGFNIKWSLKYVSYSNDTYWSFEVLLGPEVFFSFFFRTRSFDNFIGLQWIETDLRVEPT